MMLVLPKFSGNFKAKCAVIPSAGVAAIPEDAIARSILLFFRISAKSKLIRNIFPVLPGVSRNNRPYFFIDNVLHI